MPFIKFPNIPNVPGVPQIPRNAGALLRTAGLGILQGALLRAFQTQSKWGIFDSKGKALGDPAKFSGIFGAVLDAAGIGSILSTAGVEYSKETKVSDFPIERGSFASYNKVEVAAEPVVTLSLSGSEKNRRTFLKAIDDATKSTDLYSVVTPEITYINYSVQRYNYQRRSSKGATLLIVEITLKEIRQVSASYTKANPGNVNAPKNASATPTADNGKVQAQTPPTSTLKSLANKIPGLAAQAQSAIQGLMK